MSNSGGDLDNIFQIAGSTDSSLVGNISDRLKVDSLNTVASAVYPHIARQDINGTFTASGQTSALDSAGFGMLSIAIDITAASGTLPILDVELQSSDDAVNWTTLYCTQRFTGTGSQRFPGVRLAGKYYRFVYTIGGTTPSFTFDIDTTLKAYGVTRNIGLIRYADLDLAITGSVSTRFNPQTCSNISLMTIRSGTAVSSATYAVQASNDGLNFEDLVTTLTTNVSKLVNIHSLSGQAFGFYRLKTTANVSLGTCALDCYWRANGGS